MKTGSVKLVSLAAVLWATPAVAAPPAAARAHLLRELRALPGARAARAHWPPSRRRPLMIRNVAMAVRGTTLAAKGGRAIDLLRGTMLHRDVRLTLHRIQRSRQRTVLRYRQVYEGLPVVGRRVTIVFDRQRRVRAVHSDALALQLRSTTPTLSSRQAKLAAWRASHGRRALPRATLARARAELVIAPLGAGRLAYRVVFPLSAAPTGLAHLVDARDGRHLDSYPLLRWQRGPRRGR